MTQPAGFGVRFVANIVDWLIINLPLIIIAGLITGDFSQDNTFVSTVIFVYVLITPVLWKGYVVGKRIAGIRIVKKDGSNVHIGNMLMRTIVSGIVYGLTLGIGIIVSAFMVGIREDKRAIHDFIAGTYVTHAKPEEG
ncbi:RDD family protein [Bacillus sp. V3]|uniref:RDD family protein n=1 Tax=[Bacillus] enclensis TaxID=1402860 RepID=UPI0018D3D9A8|nr:RDD family protein [[Bacillus] enclensis]MBH9967672.1 RDD family protein [[Bacillus] enclensis]QTC41198.1 RDD family protein [Bacillus sp. V3]